MSKKPKFNPEITRIKLNPEQAVLSCICFCVAQRGTFKPHDSRFILLSHGPVVTCTAPKTSYMIGAAHATPCVEGWWSSSTSAT